ncbi:MAG: M3 family oligoendopeptidase, partial [Sediminibacterium sp.]|nr:M3 family oligoendopeptidase [Sediminibacterium sp.]
MVMQANIEKLPRHFLPSEFEVKDWATLEPFFKELLERPINSASDLQKWLTDLSELEAAISEDACWRQIKMTCDTTNPDLEAAYTYFCMEIQPKLQPYSDQLNKKLMACSFIAELPQQDYAVYLRSIEKNIRLFRDENVPLQAELSVMQQQYGVLAGKMTVEVDGQEYTLQQAAKFLESHDRAQREKVYRLIQERRLQDKDAMHTLFTQLLEKRHQVAINAGFANYRDYKFEELGRFDYSAKECEQFHEAVRLHVVPLVNTIYEAKKQELGVQELRPWDLEAEPAGVEPLRPFKGGEELYQKTVACFEQLHPFFA